MPSGLPNLHNFAGDLRSAADSLSSHLRSAADFLQIPSFDEYSGSVRHTWQDSIQAARSALHLFLITFRPLLILLGLLGRYIVIVLKLLAECTVKHGIVAVREGAHQANVAVRWFIAWQKGLSQAAVLVELGVIAGLVGLYLLRRHLRKKRYFERLAWWYAMKKAGALRKYNNFVKQVSKTSMFLAILLPHILYTLLVCVTKYFAPWLIRYFATKTYSTAIISLWVPFVKTVWLVHRCKGAIHKQRHESKADTNNVESKPADGVEGKRGTFKGFGLRGKRPPVVDKYLKSMGKSTKVTSSSVKPVSSPAKSPARKRRERLTIRQQSGVDSLEVLYTEAMGLLRYWVVYALVCALCRTLYMCPIIGRFISAVDPAKQQTSNGTIFPGRVSGKGSFLSSLKLSYEFMEEVKLVFFLWLLFLPTSLTGMSHTDGGGVKAKTAAWEKKASMRSCGDLSNSPLDILYHRLAPASIALMDSSSSLAEARDTADGVAGILGKCLNFFRSFLDVAVFMKVISEQTKNKIISVMVECTALLPASITLLMPGYFTQFGCVYISRVIPAAKSASTCEAMRVNRAANDHTLEGGDMAAAMRYLKYWVVHSLLSMGLKSFAPLLAWVPLSTHVTWLIWAYAQLEASTRRLYAVFEYELFAFGLLHRHEGDGEELDIRKTVTASVFRTTLSMVNSLPSGASSEEADEGTNGKTTVENAESNDPSGLRGDKQHTKTDGEAAGSKVDNSECAGSPPLSEASEKTCDAADDGTDEDNSGRSSGESKSAGAAAVMDTAENRTDKTTSESCLEESKSMEIPSLNENITSDKVLEVSSLDAAGEDTRKDDVSCAKPDNELQTSGADSPKEMAEAETEVNVQESSLVKMPSTSKNSCFDDVATDTSPVASVSSDGDAGWEDVKIEESSGSEIKLAGSAGAEPKPETDLARDEQKVANSEKIGGGH